MKVNKTKMILTLLCKDKRKIKTTDVLEIFTEAIIKNMDDDPSEKMKSNIISFLASLYVNAGKNKKEKIKRAEEIKYIAGLEEEIDNKIKELSKELNLSEEWVEKKLTQIARETQGSLDECVTILKKGLNGD